jgi:hypothetical protein
VGRGPPCANGREVRASGYLRRGPRGNHGSAAASGEQRAERALAITEFRTIGRQVWPNREPSLAGRHCLMTVAGLCSLGDPVDPATPLDLLGDHVQAEFLLERPGNGAPDGVRLPAEFWPTSARAEMAATHWPGCSGSRSLAALPDTRM